MPLKLITDYERLKLSLGGDTCIWYRRLRQGDLPIDDIGEALAKIVVDWEGVVDDEGRRVKYKKGMEAHLPIDICNRLLQQAATNTGWFDPDAI